MSDLVLLVRIAGRLVAFDADDVHSVIDIDDVSPVPHAPPHVLGLSALRSRTVTVIDPAAAAGIMQDESCSPCGRAVAVESGPHLYALRVEEAEDVATRIGEPVPVAADIGAGWRRAARSMQETAQGPALLGDVQAFLHVEDTHAD